MTRPSTQPCLGAALLALTLASSGGSAPQSKEFAAGFASIEEDDVELHLWNLAGSALEGRDSPSAGLERAATYIETRWREAGLEPLQAESYRMSFKRTMERPVAADCGLQLEAGEPSESGELEAVDFDLGTDFVPLSGCGGEASGELVFAGFGIDAKKERYNDLQGSSLQRTIVMILEGEPRHKKRFDGPEVSRYALIWSKLEDLHDERVAGVLVVRRPPAAQEGRPKSAPELDPPSLGFRHTWASWSGERPAQIPNRLPPALEISPECASALLGEDVLELARGLDRTARARKIQRTGRDVTLKSATERGEVEIDNVGGIVRGSDLPEEFVILGAHYDHVGVDPRGRIGYGADDNASGTSALIELAEAMALAAPRRSVMFLAFAAEEDNLLGSAAFCDKPTINPDSIVAMLNMDMLGRGERNEVTVFGAERNDDLDKALSQAKKLRKTGIRKIVTKIPASADGLWSRSDHYNFHEIGVPSLFFFEGLPISDNKDYHTWRDTVEQIDLAKVVTSSKLIFNTAWLLANDDERPAASRD
jgi:hypothetical protein